MAETQSTHTAPTAEPGGRILLSATVLIDDLTIGDLRRLVRHLDRHGAPDDGPVAFAYDSPDNPIYPVGLEAIYSATLED